MNPQPGVPAAGAPQDEQEFAQRKTGWRKFLDTISDNPDAQRMMIGFGLQMMQPMSPGQSFAGHTAASVGAGLDFASLSRQQQAEQERLQQQMGLQERQVATQEASVEQLGEHRTETRDIQREQLEAQRLQQERAFGLDEARLGLDRQRLDLQREQLAIARLNARAKETEVSYEKHGDQVLVKDGRGRLVAVGVQTDPLQEGAVLPGEPGYQPYLWYSADGQQIGPDQVPGAGALASEMSSITDQEATETAPQETATASPTASREPTPDPTGLRQQFQRLTGEVEQQVRDQPEQAQRTLTEHLGIDQQIEGMFHQFEDQAEGALQLFRRFAGEPTADGTPGELMVAERMFRRKFEQDPAAAQDLYNNLVERLRTAGRADAAIDDLNVAYRNATGISPVYPAQEQLVQQANSLVSDFVRTEGPSRQQALQSIQSLLETSVSNDEREAMTVYNLMIDWIRQVTRGDQAREQQMTDQLSEAYENAIRQAAATGAQ